MLWGGCVRAAAAVKSLQAHLPTYPPEKGSEDNFWFAWKHSFFCNKLPLQSVLKIVDICTPPAASHDFVPSA